MTDKIVAFSTCESYEDALRIANHLVENQFAACVNIVPGLTSVYRWKDAIERSTPEHVAGGAGGGTLRAHRVRT